MKHQGWGVYQGTRCITKTPMTEYAAELARLELSKCFINLEIREVRR